MFHDYPSLFHRRIQNLTTLSIIASIIESDFEIFSKIQNFVLVETTKNIRLTKKDNKLSEVFRLRHAKNILRLTCNRNKTRAYNKYSSV